MNSRNNVRNVTSAKKTEAIKKEDNWKEICKDCEVLRLDLGCGFGCEIIRISFKNYKKS